MAKKCVQFKPDNLQTSTQRAHHFIPSVSQEFDCRVKPNIKPSSQHKDLVIKQEEFKSNYVEEYTWKKIISELLYRPPQYRNIHYLRNVNENMLKETAGATVSPLSEMKDSFRTNYIKPRNDDVIAPCELAKCNLYRLGGEQQPTIPVQSKGFWKWTDPYLTSYKSDYIPYDQVDPKLVSKTLTFYNASEFDLPPASGNKTMFDKTVFKCVLPNRMLTKSEKRVPNYGMQSEYQDHFIKQTFSTLHPYLEERTVFFDDTLSEASRFQNLAPPRMYCSEYCNIGGPSVRGVIDLGPDKKEFRRTEGCCKI